jgi:2-keto-4-pentenoate hydratase/2-oxohepta-3-ene-1,7-dioic acid hydratase (catechol pathway)
MTTHDEIPDPQQLELTTFLNGVQVQKDSTRNMVHSVAAIIAYVTHFTPLSPGDVIITGSPGGVGKSRTPQLFMFPGDDVAVEISKIGRLSHSIR